MRRPFCLYSVKSAHYQYNTVNLETGFSPYIAVHFNYPCMSVYLVRGLTPTLSQRYALTTSYSIPKENRTSILSPTSFSSPLTVISTSKDNHSFSRHSDCHSLPINLIRTSSLFSLPLSPLSLSGKMLKACMGLNCSRQIDYVDRRSCQLQEIPDDIYRYEDTLEDLMIDSNMIQELPPVRITVMLY